MPRTASEVVLAPQSARALDAHTGSRVELVGSRGRAFFDVTGPGNLLGFSTSNGLETVISPY